VTQALTEQDRARSAIRAMVRHHGARLKSATPTGMIAALVAAAACRSRGLCSARFLSRSRRPLACSAQSIALTTAS